MHSVSPYNVFWQKFKEVTPRKSIAKNSQRQQLTEYPVYTTASARIEKAILIFVKINFRQTLFKFLFSNELHDVFLGEMMQEVQRDMKEMTNGSNKRQNKIWFQNGF